MYEKLAMNINSMMAAIDCAALTIDRYEILLLLLIIFIINLSYASDSELAGRNLLHLVGI